MKVRVVEVPWGRGVVAAEPIAAGETALVFEGPRVPWEQVPESEIRHVLGLGDGTWMIPDSPARFADHACQPTCRLDGRRLVAIRDLAPGEPVTFVYNDLDPGEASPPWDPRWSFTCGCGAPACQGEVDGYVWWDGARWRPARYAAPAEVSGDESPGQP